MENIIEDLIRNKNYLTCITLLRDKTKCFSLIELLCEKVIADGIVDLPPSFWDDYAIALFYLGKKGKAYDCYNNIFPYSKTTLTEHDVNHYLNNMNHCIEDNQKMLYTNSRSLESHIQRKNIAIINMDPPNKPHSYNFLNPSIVKTETGYIMNMRAANYLLDSQFRYTGSGQYNTLNYTATLDQDLNITKTEQLSTAPMPYFGNFNGWEDMRLFYYKNMLHGSFTTLDATENRLQHICISNLEEENPSHILLNGYGNSFVQKNWVALVSGENLYFVYSFYPLTILKYDETVKNVMLHQCSLPGVYNKWRGGSPAISLAEIGYPDFYLCVVHESSFPVYRQRFVLLKANNDIFEIYNYSPAFHFIDNVIEFCAGIVISHDKTHFILSFGKLDREVYLAKVNAKVIFNILFSDKLKLTENPHFIVPYTEGKLKSPYTFVSCFFNLEKLEGRERKNPLSMYFEKSKQLLELDINLVIFCDDDSMIDCIRKAREKYTHKTRVIKMEMKDLPYYKHHDFITGRREATGYAGFAKNKDTPFFTILQWSKFYFLQEVIRNNWFETDYFMWIDFGIGYIASFNNHVNSFNKKTEKVTLQCISVATQDILDIRSLDSRWRCHIAGGLFGGNKNNMVRFIELFEEAKDIMIRNNVAPLEDVIMAYVSYLSPDLFDLYGGDYAEIISNRSYLYSTSNFHLIMYNIEKTMTSNMTDMACHFIKYVLQAFNNGYIKLDDATYQKIMAYHNALFFF